MTDNNINHLAKLLEEIDNMPFCTYKEEARWLLENGVIVPPTRCKDCKYQDDCARQMVHTTRDYVLEQNISTYNKVDYCSYGELKEREGK
jgi:hypothetical protein